ncbi:uncharacterized protein LOC131892586, partial [Tigriopus californicus]|uniref:uncharacterized protein LOC131892586 n=1 Tax=Tigriopus californicus TaxID=6832 RepID=UPI0027D9E307
MFSWPSLNGGTGPAASTSTPGSNGPLKPGSWLWTDPVTWDHSGDRQSPFLLGVWEGYDANENDPNRFVDNLVSKLLEAESDPLEHIQEAASASLFGLSRPLGSLTPPERTQSLVRAPSVISDPPKLGLDNLVGQPSHIRPSESPTSRYRRLSALRDEDLVGDRSHEGSQTPWLPLTPSSIPRQRHSPNPLSSPGESVDPQVNGESSPPLEHLLGQLSSLPKEQFLAIFKNLLDNYNNDAPTPPALVTNDPPINPMANGNPVFESLSGGMRHAFRPEARNVKTTLFNSPPPTTSHGLNNTPQANLNHANKNKSTNYNNNNNNPMPILPINTKVPPPNMQHPPPVPPTSNGSSHLLHPHHLQPPHHRHLPVDSAPDLPLLPPVEYFRNMPPPTAAPLNLPFASEMDGFSDPPMGGLGTKSLPPFLPPHH